MTQPPLAILAALPIAAFAAGSFGQVGTADFRWQASLDGGASWHGDWLDVPEATTSVRVRALVSWSADAGYAFAAARFDVVIADAGEADAAHGFLRPVPFDRAIAQTIVASRFGNVIKIDDARDTMTPGEGPFGVFPAQLAEWGSPPGGFYSQNPVVVFEFVLSLARETGPRVISEYFSAPTAGNTTDRVIAIYTNNLGSSQLPLTTRHALTLNVIPAPASLGLLLPLLALHRRRRE